MGTVAPTSKFPGIVALCSRQGVETVTSLSGCARGVSRPRVLFAAHPGVADVRLDIWSLTRTKGFSGPVVLRISHCYYVTTCACDPLEGERESEGEREREREGGRREREGGRKRDRGKERDREM